MCKCNFGPFFYNECKARQDKMLYCASKSGKNSGRQWRLKDNFSRQGEKLVALATLLVTISSPGIEKKKLQGQERVYQAKNEGI